MAEQAMERAQKARRRGQQEYDYVTSSSSEEEQEEDVFGLHAGASTTTNANSNSEIRKRGAAAVAPSSSSGPMRMEEVSLSSSTSLLSSQTNQKSTPSDLLLARRGTTTFQSLLEQEEDETTTQAAADLEDDADLNHFELQPILKDNSSTNNGIPGVAGYLEIEEEPPRHTTTNFEAAENQPISTSSGLLLTHRKSPTLKKPQPSLNSGYDNPQDRSEFLGGTFSSSSSSTTSYYSSKGKKKKYLEVEHPFHSFFGGQPQPPQPHHRHSMAVLNARRLLSYVRIWMILSGLLVLSLTGVLWHSFHYEGAPAQTSLEKSSSSSTSAMNGEQSQEYLSSSSQQQQQQQHIHIIQHPDKILLLPLENASQLRQQQDAPPPKLLKQEEYDDHRHLLNSDHHHHSEEHSHHHPGVLRQLRQDFEQWAVKHNKQYKSHEEKEHRWGIWLENHHKTAAKNQRHGPCKLTQQPVFGDNHFKDLSHEEFKAQFLTGYTGPTADALAKHQQQQQQRVPGIRSLSPGSGHVLDPSIHKATIHPTVHERMLKNKQTQEFRHEHDQRVSVHPSSRTVTSPNCEWYDVPCWLRWIWRNAEYTVGAAIGTLEPAYDAESYPNAVDWRQSGAVTDIRSQGDCGACWAITAVENIESAYFIATGTLYDLSETEVIACDDSCEMCNGGWPQNAYEYVMEHGGLPLKSDLAYDGTTLMSLTTAWEQSDEDSDLATTVANYQAKTCPAGDSQASGSSNSQDGFDYDNGNQNSNYGDYTSRGRYANIKGYGYATERCVCYSDGSGCDCDDQDETMAIRNIATYGPAVVCIEASLWQDYTGGIITTDLGCTSEFLDMNHCVQVVGYAYGTGSVDGQDDEEGEEQGSNSHSGSQDEGEGDRQGYWIVRNQWGNYWGMSGYAYVAMGANTCGILNDMTIVQN